MVGYKAQRRLAVGSEASEEGDCGAGAGGLGTWNDEKRSFRGMGERCLFDMVVRITSGVLGSGTVVAG